MCGIIAVVRRPSGRPVPDGRMLSEAIRNARELVRDAGGVRLVPALGEAAALLESSDALLRGTAGLRCLLGDRAVASTLEEYLDDLQADVGALEARLDLGLDATTAQLESLNAALLRVKDATWALRHDRMRAGRSVADLAGADASPAAVDAFFSVHVALSAIDRLEVRGRDSAGLHLLVRGHALDLGDATVLRLIEERNRDPLFGSGSVRTPDGMLGLVYKAAAEIGELGDNTARLRAAMRDDALLHLALANDRAQVTVVGHTRWASVGIISEANAHPLNQEELGIDGPYVVGALNGDVDNYADLIALESLHLPSEITTDAKVIPTLVSHHLANGAPIAEAFRATVSTLEGSLAIAANSVVAPDEVLLALRGSGQALYVGLAQDAFVVASEPYGLVEETSRYVRMDGETPAIAGQPSSRGQVIVLDAAHAGTVAGIRRTTYDGMELPVAEDEVAQAEITTRDIDRGDAPHFLLKEINEAPSSFRKTMRGKIVEESGRLQVALESHTLSDDARARLRNGSIRRVTVIGQGTAAVAGQSLAAILQRLAPSLLVDSSVATELSGFSLDDDMSDTLIVAISQSGTTTDTNRTVDLARGRGAHVVAIVNRRNSDLVDKSDGVLFTSDGRDVEMSVASTKAFYSQIAAGCLLAIAIAQEVGGDAEEHDRLLRSLRELPDAMAAVIDQRTDIAAAATRHAPSRRNWAVVGNGVNRIAAQEVRIKLSELCYKAIACDVTEDKKHIDLSSEPLIFVCAAGLSGSNADDVAKEVAIYRAHKAAPIVVATVGESRYSAAAELITVPVVHPQLAFVLSAMAGHLFGYEAALAIDSLARPLREARASIEQVVSSSSNGPALLTGLAAMLEGPAAAFFDGLRANVYDGSLEASTAVRVAALLRYALGVVPLESFQIEFGKVGTPSTVIEDLTAALTRAIEELTRPIDAIKHQAKTVTVGISRSDETLLRVPLVEQTLEAGASRDTLSYRTLRTLVDLDPAVLQVLGYTRYRVEGDVARDALIHVVDRGGLGAQLPSRTETDPRLRGTKHRAATEREVTVARGHDRRTVVIVPEVKGNQTVGLTLLHVLVHERLPYEVMRAVLHGYRGRYAALKDAVTETEPTFDDTVLGAVDTVDLLIEPVYVLARNWGAV